MFSIERHQNCGRWVLPGAREGPYSASSEFDLAEGEDFRLVATFQEYENCTTCAIDEDCALEIGNCDNGTFTAKYLCNYSVPKVVKSTGIKESGTQVLIWEAADTTGKCKVQVKMRFDITPVDNLEEEDPVDP